VEVEANEGHSWNFLELKATECARKFGWLRKANFLVTYKKWKEATILFFIFGKFIFWTHIYILAAFLNFWANLPRQFWIFLCLSHSHTCCFYFYVTGIQKFLSRDTSLSRQN
jgi:hypothetical protein